MLKNQLNDTKETMDRQACLNDFKLLSVVGKGSYIKILLVSRKIDQKLFIMKVLKKKRISDQTQLQEIVKDKAIFKQLSHPFLIKMQQQFNDQKKHYFIFQYCPQLSLLQVLLKKEHLNQKQQKIKDLEQNFMLLRFCWPQNNFISIIQFTGSNVLIIQSPTSVFLQKTGYIKLIDFGVSSILHKVQNRIKYFCQGPEYFAPEIIKNEEIGKSLDWWYFGCLLYEMVQGHPPFINEQKDQIRLFQDILFAIPDVSQLSVQLSDLLLKLLQKDPNKRLGCNGSQEIQAHSWFKGINFSEIMRGEMAAPIIPTIRQTDWDGFDYNYLFMK